MIIISALYSCNKTDEANIIGRINGKIPDQISYSVPENGVSFSGFSDTIKPDSSGGFQIKLNLEDPSFLILTVAGLETKTIVIEPGEQYNISVNTEANNKSFKISGANEEGQNLYNTLPNPFLVQLEAKKYFKETSTDTIKKKIAALKENDITRFKNLLDDKKISKQFFKLVMIDRDCYYATLAANIQFIKYVISSSGTPPGDHYEYPSEMKINWGDIYTEYPPDQPELMGTRWWFEYATTFLNYKEYLSESYKTQNISGLQKSGLYHTHNIDEAKNNFSGPALEYYIAAYIYFRSLDLAYEKEFISIFDKFKADFPKSRYIKYLEPWINTVIEFHKIADTDFNENIWFVENYDKIVSLKDALKLFKGKKIYIDIWATWCEPCKYEFKKEDGLIRTLRSQGTEILFISIDNEARETLWKDMIKYYDLQGYHIRASKQLNDDLRNIFSQNHKGSFYIPFHILIDESGEIIKTE